MNDTPRCRELAAAAARYATELGWPVRPQHGFHFDGTCTCGNRCAPRDRGKHPARRNWQTMASTDPALIASWWTFVPFNIATHLAGVVAVDVDSAEQLPELAKFGPWPVTPTQRSGRGWHLFFRPPPGGLPSLSPMRGVPIETKGEGASLTLAPSRHQNGTVYRWVRDPFTTPLAEIPAAFLELVRHVHERRERYATERPALNWQSPTDVAKLLERRASHARAASGGVARGLHGLRRTLEEAGAPPSVLAAVERSWHRVHGERGDA